MKYKTVFQESKECQDIEEKMKKLANAFNEKIYKAFHLGRDYQKFSMKNKINDK